LLHFFSASRNISISLVLCQEIGWEERLQNDLFCVK